ncbi:sigma-70 family RNA polymerase sigma factor [Candidatus Saccharibacteria bacterium]|nr:sigma-70 family RNA polymerase sigma factor [Calditrichia bacterium]NIV99995.1 sigma-70 family RNA polymerase sigma factor [Candidatus Saccharibacteria bacterium]
MVQELRSLRVNHRFSLEKYLDEISHIPLLTPEEEITLTRRIKQGDQEALQKLIRANLRFVVKVAKEYQNQGLPLIDLINEGNLGLIKAAKRFDETRGFKFISYAVWWIRQSILKSLAEYSRVVRLPLNRVGLISKVNQLVRELEQKYNREPSFEEISNEMNIGFPDISEAMSSSAFHVSLDQPINRSEDGTMKEIIRNPDSRLPDGELVKESLQQEIRRVLKSLTAREEKIIKMYFGVDYERPYTLEEIGERLKLTRERVRQIKERALIRLRHQSRSQNLKLFL